MKVTVDANLIVGYVYFVTSLYAVIYIRGLNPAIEFGILLNYIPRPPPRGRGITMLYPYET